MTPGHEAGSASSGAAANAGPGAIWRCHSDVIVAGVIIAFCAVAYAITFTFDIVPASISTGMQAAAFPRLVLMVMVMLAVALAITARGRPDPAREPITPMVLYTAAAILAFMAVLYIAGIVGAIVSIIFIGRLWGERRWPLMLACAAGLAIVLHLVFVKGFGVQLPGGMIDDWLR